MGWRETLGYTGRRTFLCHPPPADVGLKPDLLGFAAAFALYMLRTRKHLLAPGKL